MNKVCHKKVLDQTGENLLAQASSHNAKAMLYIYFLHIIVVQIK